MRTLIKAGTIITVDPLRTVIRDGAIVVNDGTIEKILPISDLQNLTGFEGEVVDASALVAIPGFVQTHIHLCQTLFRGLADDLDLLDWLRFKVFPFEAALDAGSMRVSAFLGIAELLHCGTTTIMDMGSINCEEEVIRAVDETGIRAHVGKAMMDVNEHYGRLREPTNTALQSSRRLAESLLGRADRRIRYAFAPRFVLSCTERLLRETNEMAQSMGALVHTHAAENKLETQAVHERCQMNNIEYLGHIDILHARTCLAHCIWLNPREVDLIKEREAKVLHCPSSNLKLGSGVADIPLYLSKGISVSLGADGAPCNNTLNVFSEMRLSSLIQKPLYGPNAMPAQTVFEMATIGGAKALGMEGEVGSIESGKKADIVLLDIDRPWNPAAAEEDRDLYSTVVYSCDSRNVHSVMADGRWLLRKQEIQTFDEESVNRQKNRELQNLLQRVET